MGSQGSSSINAVIFHVLFNMVRLLLEDSLARLLESFHQILNFPSTDVTSMLVTISVPETVPFRRERNWFTRWKFQFLMPILPLKLKENGCSRTTLEKTLCALAFL